MGPLASVGLEQYDANVPRDFVAQSLYIDAKESDLIAFVLS